MLAIFLVALALRTYRLHEWPPGLFNDEAANGLDGLAVLRGERPIFFPRNTGREPLFLYLQAGMMALLGPTPYALRLTAAIVGALAVPAASSSSLEAIFRSPTARNLVRVFFLQERLKGFGKDCDFKPVRVHVIGAGVMGGDIATECALRGMIVTLQDQSIERIAPNHADICSQAIAMAAGKPCGTDSLPLLGQRQDCCDPGRFRGRQAAGIMAEIALRPGICAVGADARFRDVEVNLHNPPLSPDRLNQQREPCFETFSEKAAALPQEGVLCCLLADRRAASDTATTRVSCGGLEYGLAVEPAMRAEFSIFSGDSGTRHVRIHIG